MQKANMTRNDSSHSLVFFEYNQKKTRNICRKSNSAVKLIYKNIQQTSKH